MHLGQNLYFTNRYEESINACQDALALNRALQEAQKCIDQGLTALAVLGSIEERESRKNAKASEDESP